MNERKNNLSIRRIGLCWEATRAPRWTRIPQAGAEVLRPGRPADCGLDNNAINPGQRGKTSTKTNWISILAVNQQSDIHAEPVQMGNLNPSPKNSNTIWLSGARLMAWSILQKAQLRLPTILSKLWSQFTK
jgi:hypothetical protein